VTACILEPPVPWCTVFGNDRPVEVEIGPGRGELLLAFAANAQQVNFFAIEHERRAAEAIMAGAVARDLHNVCVVAGDARCVVGRLVPDASVAAYHLYFPDPWPKRRHRRRRLVSGGFARDLFRTLLPGGALHLATDLHPLLDDVGAHLVRGGLVHLPDAAPPSRPTTAFERKYARAGTHYARFIRPR